jgi:class 3 adenylate cyclase
MERQLAAILAADVVGYSRFMGEDEAGILTARSTQGLANITAVPSGCGS